MWRKSIKVLMLVEDNPGDARLLREMLKEQGTHKTDLIHVESMGEAERRLAGNSFDAILLDLGLPDAQDWMRYSGRTRLRLAFHLWCLLVRTMSRWPRKRCKRERRII